MQLRAHCESWPGQRGRLEDRFTCARALEENGVFFGVYDGHGGQQVAEQVQERLPRHLLTHYKSRNVQPASRDEKLLG
jgi:serine/threonine protein phosphatase PrpC